MLHRWLDSWAGVGLIAVGMHRQGLRLSVSQIMGTEWGAMFMSHPLISASGFGVAPPWTAVQIAASAALRTATTT